MGSQLSYWQAKRQARILFKQLKVGLKSWEQLTPEQRKLVLKYYPFLSSLEH